jgi:hypothetical protein
LPRSIDDVVKAVREAQQLGQTLRIRSKGHSSNDLVLTEGGAVLCTQFLDGIIAVDHANATATIHSGVVLAEFDEHLRGTGLGLQVIGDHNHITAGGFASVGGISPASHRFGLFIDTVRSAELVDWQGNRHIYTRENDRDDLYRVLGGTGRYGVLVALTLDLQRVDKWGKITENQRFITSDLSKFVAHSRQQIAHPEDAMLERGLWLEYPLGKSMIRIGQFSSYFDTKPLAWKSFRNRLSYGYLHFLGRIAGRLPRRLDMLVKALGTIGVVFSPRYASIKNVETFTDKVLDSSVGDPTRMLIALAPMDRYETLFRALHALTVEYRDRYRCFTFISFYVKAIHSPWLSGDSGEPFCELMLYLGVRPSELTSERLDALVGEIDRLCIEQGAFRYMHTKTGKHPAVRQKLDPQARYAEHAEPEGAATGTEG